MGPKQKKPLTEEELFEQKLQVEQELTRVLRQYHILERDRGAFAGARLEKRKRIIKILKKEYLNVAVDLNIATSNAKLKEDHKRSENLHNLLNGHDHFETKISTSKNYLKEVEEQITQTKKEIMELRSKQVTDVQHEKRIFTGQKTLENLENKLEMQMKKFCTILTENQKFREEIEHLLLERQHFNKLWNKFITSLYSGKKIMLDLIEQATIAYDQREEWCNKLQMLRTKAHSDLIVQTQEMRDLQGKIDDDEKLRDFLNVKCQKRVQQDLKELMIEKRATQRKMTEKLLEEYTQLLNNIYEFTGQNNVPSIINDYVKEEETNFSYIKYITYLHDELEMLNRDLNNMHGEIDNQNVLMDKRQKQQMKTLEKLQEELEEEKKMTEEEENRLDESEKNLNVIITGVHGLFSTMRCNNDSIMELLGDNSSINYKNLMLYLRIVERKTEELLMATCYKEKSDRKKSKATNLLQEEHRNYKTIPVELMAPTNPCPLCVSHEQVSLVIDKLQFALNRKQIEKKLAKRLELPDGLSRLHNVSACNLPESRQIIQKRYQ